MPRKVDREVLVGFIEEAKGYLPIIRQNIEIIRADITRLDAMEETHRHAHTIKGAASMVGLTGLSHIAYYMEEALEEIAAGQLAVDSTTSVFLRGALNQIEAYLDGVLSGNLQERPLVVEATRAYRRARGLPADEDETALAEVLADVPAISPTLPTKAVATIKSEIASPVKPTIEPLYPSEDVSPELIEAFTLEAEDHLRNISSMLIDLGRKPDNKELVQAVRRSVHTLKGAAGAVGFRALARLSHRIEDLLDLLYEGSFALTQELHTLLLDSTDVLEDLISSNLEASTAQEVLSGLYNRFDLWLGQAPVVEPPEGAPARKLAPLGEEPVIDLAQMASQLEMAAESNIPASAAAEAPRLPSQVVRVPIERLDELVRLVSELVITRSTFEQRMTEFGRSTDELKLSVERLRRISTILETQYEVSALGGRFALVSPDQARQASSLPVPTPQPSFTAHGFDELEFDRYTEFHRLTRELGETTSDINTLDNELINLIGDFDSILNRQGRLSSEIQEKLMRIRMVPLATLVTRLHRAVRVLANEQGKIVDLLLEGEHTELDKTVLEEIADPLLHILRNAVDHGIEPPALRQVMGKPEQGVIRLRAYHEGNQVVIQISDDGAGLEPQLIRSAAVSKGYVAAADAAQLSEEDLRALIFLPGFSTAGEISEVSGRGVGLDIVKTSVHKLKGTLSLDSSPGQGTTFTIRLPMTLAVTRALMVRANGETFAIPLDSVTQILRIGQDEYERIGDETVLRAAGKVYPLLILGEALHLKQPPDDTIQRFPVLILNAGGKQAALMVERILGGREIVIKTLGSHLRRVPGVTGATLMGDGSVILILNPNDLLSKPEQGASHVLINLQSAVQAASTASQKLLNILVVDDSTSVRRVLSNLVKSAGWQPLTARDGLEALEVVHRSTPQPDLILLDIEMPRMDGYEFLATLKSQEAYQDIPVIVLTSRAGEKHRRKALDLGAAEYVVKPYQDEALLNTIRKVSAKRTPAINSAVSSGN